FKDLTSGSVTVAISAAGLAGDSQVENVGAAVASQLAITSAAQTVGAGSCSGAVTVTAEDAFGNPTGVSSATAVNLSGAPASFFSDAACATSATSVTMAAASTTVK